MAAHKDRIRLGNLPSDDGSRRPPRARPQAFLESLQAKITAPVVVDEGKIRDALRKASGQRKSVGDPVPDRLVPDVVAALNILALSRMVMATSEAAAYVANLDRKAKQFEDALGAPTKVPPMLKPFFLEDREDVERARRAIAKLRNRLAPIAKFIRQNRRVGRPKQLPLSLLVSMMAPVWKELTGKAAGSSRNRDGFDIFVLGLRDRAPVPRETQTCANDGGWWPKSDVPTTRLLCRLRVGSGRRTASPISRVRRSDGFS